MEKRSSILEHLSIYCKKVDRSKRYVILLDVLPSWFILALLIVIFVLIVGLACIGMFGAPEPTVLITKRFPFKPEYFTSNEPLVHEVSNLSPSNLEFIFSFRFSFNNSFIDVTKQDLKIRPKLEAQTNNKWVELTIPQEERVRRLRCLHGTLYEPDLDPSEGITRVQACDSVIVFHESFVRYSNYRANISFLNIQELYSNDIIRGDIFTTYRTTSSVFTNFELGFRMAYSLLAIFIWVFFVYAVVKIQQWKRTHTTQKWLLFLLFFHIFYHDPIFWVQIYFGGWFFPFINIVLSTCLVYGFLLYLLIFFHGLFKAPKDRRFWFFFPKVALVFVCWVLTITVLTWSRLLNVADPTVTSISQVPGFLWFEGFTIGAIFLYVIYLIYYILRAIASHKKFRKKYSTRFKVCGSFAIFVLLAMTGITLLGDRTRYTGQGFSFLASHTVVFLYFSTVAFFFLPSAEPDVSKQQGGNQLVNPDLVIDEPQRNDEEEQKSENVEQQEEQQKTDEEVQVNFT